MVLLDVVLGFDGYSLSYRVVVSPRLCFFLLVICFTALVQLFYCKKGQSFYMVVQISSFHIMGIRDEKCQTTFSFTKYTNGNNLALSGYNPSEAGYF